MSLENKELVNNIESKIKYTKDNCKLFIELGILKELMRLNDNIEIQYIELKENNG